MPAVLTDKDRKALLAALRQIYRGGDLPEFRSDAIAALAKLVGSEATSYNEVDAAKNRFFSRLEPRQLQLPGSEEIFLRHLPEHPLVRHQQQTGDGRAWRISDFLSRRQYRNLGLYTELYRKLGAEYQMSVCIPSAPGGAIVALAANRRSKDFTDRDRTLANAMRPHLAQAYANACLWTHMNRALEAGKFGMIVVNARGRVTAITPAAERWIGEFFGRRARRARRLPEPLGSWTQEHTSSWTEPSKLPRAAAPWEVERDGQKLLVRAHLGEVPDQCLLLVEKKSTGLSAASLQSLGLGPREAEVLYWVMQGKTNAEIAAILALNPGTVKKHLDRVYDKLGVYSRVGAAMHAVESLGILSPERKRA